MVGGKHFTAFYMPPLFPFVNRASPQRSRGIQSRRMESMRALWVRGVGLFMDDSGTGCASRSYLKRLPREGSRSNTHPASAGEHQPRAGGANHQRSDPEPGSVFHFAGDGDRGAISPAGRVYGESLASLGALIDSEIHCHGVAQIAHQRRRVGKALGREIEQLG